MDAPGVLGSVSRNSEAEKSFEENTCCVSRAKTVVKVKMMKFL
jgi:hypothetical protein